jgi:hypothetical protein
MSVYNPQNSQSFLQELENMSTDIREIKATFTTSAAATQAALDAANAAQAAADLADSKAVAAQDSSASNLESIQNAEQSISSMNQAMVRKFGPIAIAANQFVLNSTTGFYEYLLEHGLQDEAVDVEVLDAQREKQLIQTIGVDAYGVKLELSASDVSSNSWPLYAVAFGRTGSTVPTI